LPDGSTAAAGSEPTERPSAVRRANEEHETASDRAAVAGCVVEIRVWRFGQHRAGRGRPDHPRVAVARRLGRSGDECPRPHRHALVGSRRPPLRLIGERVQQTACDHQGRICVRFARLSRLRVCTEVSHELSCSADKLSPCLIAKPVLYLACFVDGIFPSDS
jgi:hypothetical protein